MSFGKLIFVGALAAAAAGAYAFKDQIKKAYDSFAKSSVRTSNEPDFGQLVKAKTSEVYLKDSRSFIFSEADAGQVLKLRDSIFVGPNSNATLVLADEFGGGRILLAANTVVTLSQAGKRNEIPTLDVRQGEIQILEAPKPRPARDRKKNGNRGATTSISSEVPLMIVSGQRAIVLDKSLENAAIKIDANQEMQVSGAPEKMVDMRQVQQIEVAEKPMETVLAEIKEAPISEVASEEAPAEIEEQREPASEPEEVTEEPVVAQKQVKTKPKETPEEIKQEKLEEKISESKSLVFDTTEERVDRRKRRFQAKVQFASRKYDESLESNSSVDVDVGLEATMEIADNMNVTVGAEIMAVNAKATENPSSPPRPVKAYAELKYHLMADPSRFWRLSLVGGYSYQSSLGSDIWTTYRSVYAPVLGLDAAFRIRTKSSLLLAPRYSWVDQGSYYFIIPATYYWNDYLGFSLSYSNLSLKISATERGSFTTVGAGAVFRF